MKKIYGFAALAAAMTLASCSNDNEPQVNTGAYETGYIAISLDNATRAASNDATKDGENDVQSIQLVTFSDNNAIEVVDVNNAVWGESDESGVEKETKNVVKVNVPENFAASTNFEVLTLINTKLTTADVQGKSLNDVRKNLITNFGNVANGSGNLVMTTAVTSDGTNHTYTTDFTGHVFQDETTAKDQEVKIYVERMAARVDLTADDLAWTTTSNKADGTIAIEIEPIGVELANLANQSYLIKALDDVTGAQTNWYVGANRSHWAYTPWTSANYTTNKNFAGYTSTDGFSHYIHENTGAQKTAVVVTAKIKVGGNENETLYRAYVNGAYYTKKGIDNALLSLLQTDGYVKTDGAGLTADDIEYVAGDEAYDSYLQINVAVKKNGQDLTATEATDALKAAGNRYRVMKFTDNVCYYYANIDNNGADGVVRNHVYDVTVGEFAGIGIPQYDPTKPINPEDPDKPDTPDNEDWKLNTTIKILDWTVYTSKPTLGGSDDK